MAEKKQEAKVNHNHDEQLKRVLAAETVEEMVLLAAGLPIDLWKLPEVQAKYNEFANSW